MEKRKGSYWRNLDHQVHRWIKTESLGDQDWVLALSGGKDSLVLERVLSKVLKKDRLRLFHFHHGGGENLSHRNQAALQILTTRIPSAPTEVCPLGDRPQDGHQERELQVYERLCQINNLSHQFHTVFLGTDLKVFYADPVFFGISTRDLNSEAECRIARLKAVQSIWDWGQTSMNLDFKFAWAHQAQDLLETRLIRLIRGAGPDGLRAMSKIHGKHLRPLLGTSLGEVLDYLKAEDLSPLEDPTNTSSKALRSWLRTEILPQIEQKRPGSLESLERSFELISQRLSKFKTTKKSPRGNQKTSFLRESFAVKTPAQQREILHRCLFLVGVTNITQNFIEEVRKRILLRQKEHTHSLGPLQLKVSSNRVFLWTRHPRKQSQS